MWQKMLCKKVCGGRNKMKGLIVKKGWLDLILSGDKPWEIRGSDTRIRGRICLIESGTGLIKGFATLVSSFELSRDALFQNKYRHRIEDLSIVKYKKPHAWRLSDAERLDKFIPYKHPQGAVVWVNLPDDILKGRDGEC
jgi:hypothetical protein